MSQLFYTINIILSSFSLSRPIESLQTWIVNGCNASSEFVISVLHKIMEHAGDVSKWLGSTCVILLAT